MFPYITIRAESQSKVDVFLDNAQIMWIKPFNGWFANHGQLVKQEACGNTSRWNETREGNLKKIKEKVHNYISLKQIHNFHTTRKS